MRASGTYGELRVGYQRAARLGAWAIEIDPQRPGGFAFSASISDEQTYWIAQGPPYDLALALGTAEWLWREAPIVRGPDGTVTAILTERPIATERARAAQGE